ncbi:MAG TPA: ABC transporter substrate-binding protein [Thermoanaerobaculia bacterium]
MTAKRKLIALSAAVTILAGCTASEPEAPGPQRPLTRVTLNLNPTLTYAPLVIAKEEGYFAAEGIDAEFITLDPNSAVGAAATGKLDVLSAGVRSGVFNMIMKGARMRIVSDKGYSSDHGCTHEAFIAPAAVADRIAARGGSLRGEKIAVMRGGMVEMLFDRLLEYSKTSYEDVVFVQLPQGSAASTRDRIDAIRYANEPDLSNALHDGWAKVVVSTETVAPGHHSAVLVFGRRLLDDPDLGERVMRAYLRGVRSYQQGKTPRNVEILSAYTKLPADIIHRACWTTVMPDGQLNIDQVQLFLDWALAKNYLDREAPASQWWDPSFIEAAASQPDAR